MKAEMDTESGKENCNVDEKIKHVAWGADPRGIQG